MRTIKQIVLMILICSAILFISSCGSKKEIDMSGKEALNMLSLTYKSVTIKKTECPNFSKREDEGWYDTTFLFDINLKEEYKNDYELSKILTVDYDDGKREGSKTHPSYFEINREKKQVAIQIYGFVDRAGRFNPYQSEMQKRFGSMDLFLAEPNLNIEIHDNYGKCILSGDDMKKLIKWTIDKGLWKPNNEIDLKIDNIHLRVYEKK